MVRNAVLFPVNRVKMFQDNLVIQYLAKFQNSPVNRFPDNPVNLFLVSNVNPFHAKSAGQCLLKNARTFRLRYAVEVAVLVVVVIAAQAADEDTRAEVDTAIMAKISINCSLALPLTSIFKNCLQPNLTFTQFLFVKSN